MRTHFEAAARHSTAYYGQLARARLELTELELQTPPEHASAASVELLRAFPDIGVPPCSPIGPALSRSIVYSVARTERIQSARRVAGKGSRSHAGHARGRTRHRQEIRRDL